MSPDLLLRRQPAKISRHGSSYLWRWAAKDTVMYNSKLEEIFEKSCGKLLKSSVYDVNAFNILYDSLQIEAGKFIDKDSIPKQLIIIIVVSSESILNQAEYVQEARANKLMADKLIKLLHLVAYNERPLDRKPGVPRII
jgi:hypothetical protein